MQTDSQAIEGAAVEKKQQEQQLASTGTGKRATGGTNKIPSLN